ncbi:glutamine synthetase III [Candidatus Haliotispira prima]|uniref:Glutamine synthetase III n=1 Tax=Candidatus Haliotispira prima TaxID=3034016 RepID=A0ABY8ME98_9SPIO|nr:glutamine synthetase III [Candidatus Haliotispira prima]
MSEKENKNYNFEEAFGKSCFTDYQLQNRLPKSCYKALLAVGSGEKPLDLQTADVIATAMKDWALENGATHFSHWFHPLTGSTAEKHEAFIVPQKDGTVISEFSGKELIMGEPDASSFPNGGLRNTFEARGYTAWDTSSPAFLKKNSANSLVLCIPTVFVSYTGEALDKKAPLLRSMAVVSKQAVRVLQAIGEKAVSHVDSTVGAEQEYFLVSRELFNNRPDLRLTGRTMIGSMPAKGQELEDHYFGSIAEKVSAFMAELNEELWDLGVAVRTQHNEVAPNQFELAPIFSSSNLATDQNQITMETLKRVAERNDLVCLLHEKPYAGVNGSGKHNNWSLSTNTGVNLLDPGKNAEDNRRFLLFVAAVLKAVDKYAALLRLTASSAGNDHRLGANEAPPAIISVFLGKEMEQSLADFAGGKSQVAQSQNVIDVGSPFVPDLPKDNTDRNRTSPFAFTGNKFEFRMVGSAMSIADPNIVLNTAVAEILAEFADVLEKSPDVNKTIQELVAKVYSDHKRVIFNGNGYADEWQEEAAKRGLPNLKNTPAVLPTLLSSPVTELFEKHEILSKEELHSRYEIRLETYNKLLNIEALILEEMANTGVIPAGQKQLASDVKSICRQEKLGLNVAQQKNRIGTVNDLLEEIIELSCRLNTVRRESEAMSDDLQRQAEFVYNKMIPLMEDLREQIDGLEHLCDRRTWPYPSYEELLFTL